MTFLPYYRFSNWRRWGLLLAATIVTTFVPIVTVPQTRTPQPARPIGTPADQVVNQLLAMPAPTPKLPGAESPAPAALQVGETIELPADDAPLDKLVAYWSGHRIGFGRNRITPTAIVGERLLAACAADPMKTASLLAALPTTKESADRVKKLYDLAQNNADYDDGWRNAVRDWLRLNSTYFLAELTPIAASAKDKGGWVGHEDELKALVRLDRESALPVLQTLLASGQPRTVALVHALLYRDAIEQRSSGDEDRYRAILIATAADRNAPMRARDIAIDALSLTDWTGREDWYLSLFADGTLRKASDGIYSLSPLTTAFEREPDKWIPAMTKLVGSNDPAVRQNAASCLVLYAINHPRRDVILPVLRWLSDPEWLDINGTQRAWFTQAMDELEIPESVPGLIWIVENEEWNRKWAARTLAHYRDPRAIGPLKRALADEEDESDREDILAGLLASGGIPENEQVDSLQAYAAVLSTPEGREKVGQSWIASDVKLPIPVSIGRYLAQQKDAPESLIRAALDRAAALKRSESAVAEALVAVVQAWQAKAAYLDQLRRLAEGTATAENIATALKRRDELAKAVPAELRSLTGAGGNAPGVAAVLLGDADLAASILGGRNDSATAALLACARLVPMALPVGQVGLLLNSKSAIVAAAAEKYLLAEDSREARELLWAHHPNQAFITGWRENIPMIGGDDFSAMDKPEASLRAEVLGGDGAPQEIYALLSNRDRPDHVVRIYSNKATITWYENEGRYRDRVITAKELQTFREFLRESELFDRGPQISYCHYDCSVTEMLALNHRSGRRVFSHQGMSSWIGVFFTFQTLREGAKTHYALESEVPGAKILVADDSLTVLRVRGAGADILLQVERDETGEEVEQRYAEYQAESAGGEVDDAEKERRRQRDLDRDRARVTWRNLVEGKLGATVDPPAEPAPFDESRFQIDEAKFLTYSTPGLSAAVAGDEIILITKFVRSGLWKKAPGREAVQISTGDGIYADPVATPDGSWVVAARTDTGWEDPNYLIRFDLKTGREFRVDLPPAEELAPIAYLTELRRVLVRRACGDRDRSEKCEPAAPEFYLVDPATGAVVRAAGEVAPLLSSDARDLQPASEPGMVWAAVHNEVKNETRVGRYRLKDLSFQTVTTIPHLTFKSNKMWVDEGKGVVYVAFEGQLISVPLAASSK